MRQQTYRFECCPNPDFAVIHVSKRISHEYFSSFFGGDEPLNDFLTLLRSVLADCDGIDRDMSFGTYQISVKVGRAFDRIEVLENAWSRVCDLISSEHNLTTPWERLPDIRSDIDSKVCPQCQKIRDEEYRELGII